MPPRRLFRKKRSLFRQPTKPKKRVRKRTGLRAAKNQRNELIEWVRNLKKRPCADCKRLYPSVCMDLDHLPRFKKSFTISSFLRDNGHLPNARALVEAEVAKCEVVCSNCHRIRTARRAKGRLNRWW